MSDPVSSMDVEDVLSSIRRLVSEEAKGNGLTSESASEIASADLHEAAEEAANGPLSDIVQAVEDGVEDGAENGAEGGAEGGSAYGTGTPPSNDVMQEDSGVSFDAASAPETGAETGSEPEDGQVAFRHKARGSQRSDGEQKLVLTAAFRVADPAMEAPETAPDAGVSLDRAETSNDGATDGSGKDAPAYPHLRPVEDAADDEAASGSGGSGGSAGSGADILRHLAGSPDDTLFDRARQAMEAVRENAPVRAKVAPPQEDPSVQETAEVSPLRRDIQDAGLDRGPENTDPVDAPDAVEPVEPVEPVNARSPASPFNAQGGAFSQPVADTDTDAGATEVAEASTINFAEEDPSVLDEDTLRDLVSDMVREELQGELGDRITRNVRKLVRREIQRALASRAFE